MWATHKRANACLPVPSLPLRRTVSKSDHTANVSRETRQTYLRLEIWPPNDICVIVVLGKKEFHKRVAYSFQVRS